MVLAQINFSPSCLACSYFLTCEPCSSKGVRRDEEEGDDALVSYAVNEELSPLLVNAEQGGVLLQKEDGSPSVVEKKQQQQQADDGRLI